ncbi:MAG TPA: hypothetical protein VHL80_13370 [Polyangia bacterium]|nr:hypothetical protein [Polyangia bacterium]
MSTRWSQLVDDLRGAEYRFGLITPDTPTYRVDFAEGLSHAEVAAIEGRFGFRFPLDLREFLQTALPVGPRFPDWRSGGDDVLREWLAWPAQGVLTDVHRDERCWRPEWGERPGEPAEAVAVVERLLADAPRMIPIYAHRMMPDSPPTPGNPVFSIYGMDIIYCGIDLEGYLRGEFNRLRERPVIAERRIEFWSALASW